MCIRGFIEPSDGLEPSAADPGITGDEPRTIVEVTAKGTDSGVDLPPTSITPSAAVGRRRSEQPYG